MNDVGDDWVVADLYALHDEKVDMEIDWMTGEFSPASLITEPIRRSIVGYRSGLKSAFALQNVDIDEMYANI